MLSVADKVEGFSSGVGELDRWLRSSALVAAAAGTAATYVLCRGERVVGYYALAMSAVSHQSAPSRLRRGMPDPVAVVLLARLALDRAERGTGLGGHLLIDALRRCVRGGHEFGARCRRGRDQRRSRWNARVAPDRRHREVTRGVILNHGSISRPRLLDQGAHLHCCSDATVGHRPTVALCAGCGSVAFHSPGPAACTRECARHLVSGCLRVLGPTWVLRTRCASPRLGGFSLRAAVRA